MRGYGCALCPANQECDANYRGSRCAATRYAAGVDFDPKTVGDDIRVMEPEQLAELLSIRFCNGQQKQECLDWLNTCIDKPNKT